MRLPILILRLFLSHGLFNCMPTLLSFCKYLIVSLVIGATVFACRKSTFSYQYQKPSTKDKAASQMLFMSFVATARQDSATRIEQFVLKQVEGSFKDLPIQSQFVNRLEIKLLDGRKKELSSYSIDHPLFKNVEYQDASNRLVTKLVRLPKEEFFVRVTLPSNTVFVRIDEIKQNLIVGQTFFKLK